MREFIHSVRGQFYLFIYGIEMPRSPLLDHNITVAGEYLNEQSNKAITILYTNFRWLIYGKE